MNERSALIEIEYNNKLYLYDYLVLRDDADGISDGYGKGTDEELYEITIYDEFEHILKETEIPKDPSVGIVDDDIIKLIELYKL